MPEWLKDIQSMGRGIRNGEMTVVMTGRRSGKTMPVILDMESQGIEPSFTPGYIRHFKQQHWCHNAQTDKWTHHTTRPFHEYISTSDLIIIRGQDNKFYWYKDRYNNQQRELTEEEVKDLTFVLLGAEHVEPGPFNWTDLRTSGAPFTNLCNEIEIL